MMGDHDVTLSEQLACALDADACFCIACGQPDEPSLHDPARCRASGGENDQFTVVDAVAIFDASCEQEPDLEDEARALHCAMLAAAPTTPVAQANGDREAVARLAHVLFVLSDEIEDECAANDLKAASRILAALPVTPALGREGVEFDRLTRYPTYIDDPDGLDRIRAGLKEVADWHDLPGAIVNCNSVARLLDTIEYQRAVIASQSTQGADKALVEALEAADSALRNHACHGGPTIPCTRTPDQCAFDCGREAGDALLLVVAALSHAKDAG